MVWNHLPSEAYDLLLTEAESAAAQAVPPLAATLYLDFTRNGNRSNYEAAVFARRRQLADLVLGECIEGEGRFFDAIADAVWMQCEESTWTLPAHIPNQDAGSGLPSPQDQVPAIFSCEAGALLAWTLYLLGARLDDVSPMLRQRIRYEVGRRIIAPCIEKDTHWWMSFRPDITINNWNPWCNSNWLACALLIEDDERIRQCAAAKAVRSLEVFLNSYPEDGGCDEGPGYWGHAAASLFEALELLQSAVDEPMARVRTSSGCRTPSTCWPVARIVA